MEQIEIAEYQKILERNPFCKLLGLEVTSVSEGHVQGRIPFDSRFQNMYGDYHGGALYAAADTFWQPSLMAVMSLRLMPICSTSGRAETPNTSLMTQVSSNVDAPLPSFNSPAVMTKAL